MPKSFSSPDDPQHDDCQHGSSQHGVPQHGDRPGDEAISRLLTGIWRLSHALKQDVEPLLQQELQVDLRQTMLLRAIRNGCQYPKLLAEQFKVPPTLISRQLDGLLKLGLIERQIDAQDSRRTRLTLTDKGEAATASVFRLFRERTHERLGQTTAEELNAAIRLLEQLQAPVLPPLPASSLPTPDSPLPASKELS